MPDRRFELWQKRIRWARKIHQGMGLIGRDSEKNTMRQLIEFYRSNQWKERSPAFMALPMDALRVVNKIFPIANRQQAGVAARNPRVQYFPRREKDKPFAPHAEALHNYDIREQKHIGELNAALRDAQFAPFPGIIRHGYTPDREIRDEDGKLITFNPKAHPNRPWIQRSAPWDTLIDPRARDFTPSGGAMWCAFRSVMTLDQIKRNPEMIAREKLRGFAGNISQPFLDMMPDDLRAKEDPDLESYVEVWSIYDFETREWMQMTLEGVDDWLRKPDEWPIPWEWLPISSFVVNPQMDTPFPKSLMEDLLPLQHELNQVRTMMSVMVRSIRRIIFANHKKLTDESVNLIKDAALVEWFLTDADPGGAFESIQQSSLPQELLLYANQIIDDMRESVGISRFGRAQRENVESATEAANIAAGQDTIEQRTQDAFDEFVNHVEATYMQGRRKILAVTGAEETIRILGAEGAQQLETYVTIDAEMIAGEFNFEVEAGSTRPRDKDREAQLAAVDLSVADQHPSIARVDQFFRRYVEKRSLDPARYMQGDASGAAIVQGAGQLAREAGIEGQGASIDPNLVGLFGSTAQASQ